MVRETRHLWVGNLPDNIREDRIRELFKRYGRVQNVKLLGRTDNVATGVVAAGSSGVCATVAFMDIKSASKAHNAEHVLDERTLTTEYYEPAAIPSAAGAPSAGSSPAGSGYSGSSSSVNSTPAPASVSRYHLSGGEDSSSNTCPIAASAAAPAAWRGTNDSATEYCRRGNTPAAYGRYQRNNSTAPYSTPPSNVERTTPHHRWYGSGDRVAGATGGESTPSTPGGGTEGGRRRRHSGSGSSRSDSSSPEPSDTSRASTPATQPPLSHHTNHRTPPSLQHQWASTASGRPLAICVRNLPTRSTDSSLKDGLYHEYKKHGKVVWVKVVGQNADRYAVVRFKKPSDVEKALEVSQDKLFFGCKISVAPHQSCDEDADTAKPYETDIDEYHPKATRTLFIGNLEKDVTQQQLREKFKHFGRIIEIDIKKGSSGGAGYAFCQYASISSVVEAIRAMDGEYVGGSRVKLGFGKPVATTCVWVDGLTEHTEKQVLSAVSRCGGATSVCVDRAAGAALVHFEQAAAAGAAVRELRRVAAQVSAAEPDHPRLCVDYASRECQEAFYEQLEKHGGSAALTGSERLSGDLATRYLPSTRHEPVRFEGCGSRSRASSYGRASSRTPRFSTLEHYDPTDYAADRRYRVYDEVGSSPQPEDTPYEERLQSVVVSPHRARRHRRDSSPEERKHSKERPLRTARRSRSGSRGGSGHGARRRHRRRRDGSGSHSRAGTPLRDEPDAPPAEPRRAPRERPPLPMSLPLPKFAAQLLRAVPPAPRPAPAPAPDSPPRPPSASSSSAGSAPHSPSLEERIRSLDEKLNGSRALTDAPDRARLRHRLLEVDINEVKPSEVVRSLLAKRSVFDEDSERLEGARAPSPGGSPRGRSAPLTPRALRYPFPAHPPPVPPATPPPRPPRTPERRPCSPPPIDEFFRSKSTERRSRDTYPGDDAEDKSLTVVDRKESKDDLEDDGVGRRDRDSINASAPSFLRGQAINAMDSKQPAKVDYFDSEVRTDISLQHISSDTIATSARDVMDMLLKQVESSFHSHVTHESQFDKRCKFSKDIVKSETHKQEEKFKIDSDNKLDLLCSTDNYKSKESLDNEIAKELIEFEMQQSHLNAINSIKTNTLELTQDIIKTEKTEKVLKDRHSHNYHHNIKLEKENIQFDKSFEKEKNLHITAFEKAFEKEKNVHITSFEKSFEREKNLIITSFEKSFEKEKNVDVTTYDKSFEKDKTQNVTMFVKSLDKDKSVNITAYDKSSEKEKNLNAIACDKSFVKDKTSHITGFDKSQDKEKNFNNTMCDKKLEKNLNVTSFDKCFETEINTGNFDKLMEKSSHAKSFEKERDVHTATFDKQLEKEKNVHVKRFEKERDLETGTFEKTLENEKNLHVTSLDMSFEKEKNLNITTFDKSFSKNTVNITSSDKSSEKEKNLVNITTFDKPFDKEKNLTGSAYDKSFEKERHANVTTTMTSSVEKKNVDSEKNYEDRVKIDHKTKHNKERSDRDKHESDRDKLKSIKSEKITDKEKRSKEESNVDKLQLDKMEKIKTEKDLEKTVKDKSEKESEKFKSIEDKSFRHDHHKKDRSDKDKRKDSTDMDPSSSKMKKDDKHKHDRAKKDSDSKRDSKKESESIRHRKTSRDETTRELCRKDSTDSSTSRASHESSKLKDLESSESKEDFKPKLKQTDIFAKLDDEKELFIKTEIKEEKDSGNQSKVKNENTQDNCIKSKPDVSEKQRHYSLDSPSVDSKRKERLNSCSSLPSNIGHKRRMSSQDSFDSFNDDIKKCRGDAKIPQRRDSKDSRSENRHKTTKFSKDHFAKIIESKTKDDKKTQVKPPDDIFFDFKDNELKDQKINDRTKLLKKSPKEDIDEKSVDTAPEGLRNDLHFLAILELRSSEEDERQRALKKEMKEKKRIQQLQQIQELQMQQDALQQAEFMGKSKDDKRQKCDERKKDAAREKRMSTDRKSRDEKIDNSKRKNRKPQHSSDSNSDSDEPKKHSIFDIIDDGPTYISMYDKVKARSCKNMQKQEEEKRQEKIKAKFSQLKQSRAKREEKKRSSWDEDSDSDQDRKKHQKSSMDNSSDEDHIVIHTRRREKSHDYDRQKMDEYFDGSTNEEDIRNKLSRKNSRTRIISDTSDDEVSKRSLSKSPNFLDEIKKDLSDVETMQRNKTIDNRDSIETNCKRNSILNLFGKSDSDDSKLKLNIGNDNGYKSSYLKSLSNDFSSENESISNKISENRRRHKKKQKKHKPVYSDDETKVENSDTSLLESEHKHRNSEKQRRHSNKKDKRKDKLRDSIDTDDNRDERNKLKRDKKIANNNFEMITDAVTSMKKDGKMEDIFGPLSDESDRDTRIHALSKSDFNNHDIDSNASTNHLDYKLKEKDDNKRRKEKKRKEKRYFKDDDNSLDVDAVSKAIEARLFADSLLDDDTRVKVATLSESVDKIEHNDIKYAESNIISEIAKHEKFKRECRERKKKKKKNREDRQSRKEHHHIYHQDKIEKSDHLDMDIIESSSKTMLLDIPLPSEPQNVNMFDKLNDCKAHLESHSLPRLTDSPPIIIQLHENTDSKSVDATNIIVDDSKMEVVESKEIEIEEIPMPPPFSTETIVTDLSEVPLPTDPLPSQLSHNMDEFLKSFNSDGDLCEDAVRNITNSEKEEKTEKSSDLVDTLACKADKKLEEKPRAIISQEETADAVAALLGESFGGKANAFSAYEESDNSSTHQNVSETSTIENENIPEEDAEEMRQAVQNLNASEMEMKPDTPVSDNDLLLIDTDTEEADETAQDAIEKLPVNIIATNQALTSTPVTTKCVPQVTTTIVSVTKPSVVHAVSTTASNPTSKANDPDVKIQLAKRENVQIITSTATPVITSWTLTNKKMLEPHILNLQGNSIPVRDKNETKPTHITANIVQIKGPQSPSVQINNPSRPILTPARVNAPYQVINQMIRTQVPNMQPPTIKIPEPIIYQKSQGIVISPRMSNDPRLQSPKASPQRDGMTSPRLTILSSSPQSINSVGMASPNAIQQRSPGQVTVVRMQQPPLSPIQAMHMTHGARTMLSPNRPNSVLVQTQGTPIHFNRLPVTPVLAPISKQLNVNSIVQPNKGINVTTSPLMQAQKVIAGDVRKTDHRNISENSSTNEGSKIILSPTSIQRSPNPTVMAQNRLISMQNTLHIGNINSAVHLNNKVLINTVSQLNDKREIKTQKCEQNNHIPYGSTPIIHVAGVNTSTPSIIQSGTKPVSLHDTNTISRSQGSNVIHSLNSQRVLTSTSLGNVIQIDPNKGTKMATVRPPSVLTKLELTTSPTTTTTSISSISPLLLKTSPTAIKLCTKFDKDNAEAISPGVLQNHIRREIDSKIDDKSDGTKTVDTIIHDSVKEQKDRQTIPPAEHITKCETDFEELLKDNTNEIKITNDPEKKLEVNVGKTITLINRASTNQIPDSEKGVDCLTKEGNETKEVAPLTSSTKIEIDEKTSNESNSIVSDVISIDSHVQIPSKSDNSNKMKDSSTSGNDDKNISVECENSSKLDDDVKSDKPKFLTLSPMESDTIENQIKNDENDSWSAKDVNIESVIKKVDSLCNDNFEINNKLEEKNTETIDSAKFDSLPDKIVENSTPHIKPTLVNKQLEQIENAMATSVIEQTGISDRVVPSTLTTKRGGRSARGRRLDKNQDRVQTRQISKPRGGAATKRGGRGRAKVDKKIKSLVNSTSSNMPGDVYDFHEDSGDETSTSPHKSETRPRLILTIKSPLSGHSNIATSTLSITQKDQPKLPEKPKEEKNEEFVSPSPNTRKSRRLQEKDVHRTTVDDVIDDVIKGPPGQTRNGKETNKKRPTRQAAVKVNQEKIMGTDTRKSPRGVKRTRDRSMSDASIDSGDERLSKEGLKDAKTPRVDELETVVVPRLAPPPVTLPATPATSSVSQLVTPVPIPSPVPALAPGPVIVSTPAPTLVPATIPTPVPTLTAAPALPPALAPALAPAPASIPITKPPKKMISEISAKLASAFEAAAAANPCDRAGVEDAAPPSPVRAGGGGDAPGAHVALGTEATDARVQSPALPHRPPSTPATPSTLRAADRATPVLIRGGEGDSAAGAGRAFRGYSGTPSLPRGAHLPTPELALHHHLVKQVAVVGPQPQPHPHHAGAASRVAIASVPSISPQGQMGMGDGMYPHFSQQHYQMYQQHFRATQHETRATHSPYSRSVEAESAGAVGGAGAVRGAAREFRRAPAYAVGLAREPPPAHCARPAGALPPPAGPPHAGPPHASQVPREADSLQMLLQRYPVMWQGLLALKNDSAAVQMHFVGGNPGVAGDTLSRHADGSTPLLRIAQRMRLEQPQLDQVHRKMKMEMEHCMLLALPCGRDHMDVLQQSTNLTAGFITYLQRKQAAGIVNIAPPGHQQAMFTVHIFPSCEFANENLNRIAPDLMHRVADIAHLLIVIATV